MASYHESSRPCWSMWSRLPLWRALREISAISCIAGWAYNKAYAASPCIGTKKKLQFPFSSLSEEFLATRAREVLLYRDSINTRVSSAGAEVRTARKWREQEAIDWLGITAGIMDVTQRASEICSFWTGRAG